MNSLELAFLKEVPSVLKQIQGECGGTFWEGEAEADRSQVQVLPGQLRETLSPDKKLKRGSGYSLVIEYHWV